jgi:hypothetical protein
MDEMPDTFGLGDISLADFTAKVRNIEWIAYFCVRIVISWNSSPEECHLRTKRNHHTLERSPTTPRS